VDSGFIEAEEQGSNPCQDVHSLLSVAEKLVKNIEVLDKAIQERRKLVEQVKQVKKQCDLLSQNAQIGNDLLKDEKVQKPLTLDLN